MFVLLNVFYTYFEIITINIFGVYHQYFDYHIYIYMCVYIYLYVCICKYDMFEKLNNNGTM